MRKKTIEDYVELIYILEKKKKKVHTNDVANIFSISPASVTEIFQKLSDEDYIIYEKYSGVRLTKKGKKIAVETKPARLNARNVLFMRNIKKIGFFSSIFRFLKLNKIKRLSKYEKPIIHVEKKMADFYLHNFKI